MYKDTKRQLIYIAPPKTASRSVTDFLSKRNGGCGFNPFAQHHTVPSKAPDVGWQVFTVVRNHFDTFVSWLHHKNRTTPLDIKFVNEIMRQKIYYPYENAMWRKYTDAADIVLRYESLETDLSALLGIDVTLPVLGKSLRRPDYKSYFDDETRECVEDRFAGEMYALGYSFEGDE